MDSKQNPIIKKSHEIDIIGIVKKTWADKKSLAVFFVVFAALGVAVALTTNRQYTTNVVLAPEFNSGSMPEGLSDLASMVGVDIGGGGKNSMDAIYPQIYPDVLASNDFIVTLFNIPVTTEKDGKTKTYYEHLTKDGIIGLWDYPRVWMGRMFPEKDVTVGAGGAQKKDGPVLSRTQSKVRDAIRSMVSCTIDKKSNVITITVKDFDRQVAAQMADTVERRLLDYIIDYRTRKSKKDLAFAERQRDVAKAEYVKARDKYTAFADANEDVSLESYVTKRDEMENDMQLLYNSYTTALQQVQLAQAKLRENTPVFTEIQSASVSYQPSGTPRSLIVIIYVMVGMALDVCWVIYVRPWMKRRKKKAAQQEQTGADD